MRLAARWQDSWSMSFSCPEERRRTRIRLGDEPVDVIRLGKGEPLVLVPGLAGSWRLLLPLAQRLARRFQVITYGLRGDGRRRSASVGRDAGGLGPGGACGRPGLLDRAAWP